MFAKIYSVNNFPRGDKLVSSGPQLGRHLRPKILFGPFRRICTIINGELFCAQFWLPCFSQLYSLVKYPTAVHYVEHKYKSHGTSLTLSHSMEPYFESKSAQSTSTLPLGFAMHFFSLSGHRPKSNASGGTNSGVELSFQEMPTERIRQTLSSLTSGKKLSIENWDKWKLQAEKIIAQDLMILKVDSTALLYSHFVLSCSRGGTCLLFILPFSRNASMQVALNIPKHKQNSMLQRIRSTRPIFQTWCGCEENDWPTFPRPSQIIPSQTVPSSMITRAQTSSA